MKHWKYSAAAVGAVFMTSVSALAVDPTFEVEIPCSSPPCSVLTVPAFYPDTNLNGQISVDEAIAYARRAAAVSPIVLSPETGGTLEEQRRAVIAVVNAILRIHQRPQDFMIPPTYPGAPIGSPVGLTLPTVPECPSSDEFTVPLPDEPKHGGDGLVENPPTVNEPTCAGVARMANAIGQDLFGIAVHLQDLSMLNRPKPIEFDIDAPIAPTPLVIPIGTPNPCQMSPETDPSKMPMPGGDGPAYCQAEIQPAPGGGWFNPCDGTPIPGEPPTWSEPDVVWCSGTSPCSPPEVDVEPNPPFDDYRVTEPTCAGSNPCAIECLDVPCTSSDPPFVVPNPWELCLGNCKMPETAPGPSQDVPDPAMEPDGIYRPQIPPREPKEKEPPSYCGNEAGASPMAGTTPGGNATSCQPVDLVTGDKLESECDLVLPLNGRDFDFTRIYSSNSFEQQRAGVLGAGWTSPTFQELYLVEDTVSSIEYLILRGNQPNQFTRFDTSGGVFRPGGPSKSFADASGSQVIRLYEAGAGFKEFHKTGVNTGKIKRQVDEHGNQWTFEYRYFVIKGTSSDVDSRLHRIYFNGTDESNCEAAVEFGYYLVNESGDDAMRGKVARVMAYRFVQDATPSRVPFEIARVEYTYKHVKDPFSADVGTDGDLIQVVKYSRVDRAPADGFTDRQFGPVYPHRTSVLQYRYHNGAARPLTAESHQTTPPTIVGPAHAIKSVYRPAQLEYYAELLYRDDPDFGGKSFAVRDAAYRLMALPDTALAVRRDAAEYRVDDLASKIVGYAVDGKVAVQYLQSGCGCGGGVQAVREVFTREHYSVSGVEWKSTKLETQTRTSGGWAGHTTRWVDSERITLGASSPFMLRFDVLEDSTGATSRLWKTEYKYDLSRRVEEIVSPAANDGRSYAANTGSTPPSLSGGPVNGSATIYTYNSANRVLTSGVRTYSGGSPTTQTVVSIEYGSGSGSTRTHLPQTITRYTGQGSGADSEEVTTFAYTFHTPSGDVGPSAILSVQATVEKELEAENGPGGSGGYTSTQLFDTRGRLVHTISARGVASALVYGNPSGGMDRDTSGKPWTITANGTLDSAFSSFSGLINSAPGSHSITVAIERDALGRIRRQSVAGPSSSPVTSEWVYESQVIPNDPAGRTGVQRMVYTELPHRLGDGATPGDDTFAGPAMRVFVDAHEGVLYSERIQQVAASSESPLELDVVNTGLYNSHVNGRLGVSSIILSKRASTVTLSGLVSEITGWHDASGTVRPSGDQSYVEQFEYDQFGRRIKHVSAQGTVSQDVRDCRGRIIERWYGRVGDLSLTLAGKFYYDSPGSAGQGVGNGLLTLARGLAGEGPGSPAGTRDRWYGYDARDRLVWVQNPTPPHQVYVYDNLDRVIEQGDFSSSTAPTAMTSTDRGSYSKTWYSQRGTVFKTAAAIDPASSSPTYLQSHVWRDADGRVLASYGPNSPSTKVIYDELGRVAAAYVTDRRGDAAPTTPGSHADATSITDDVVLEQTENTYLGWGPLSLRTHLVRRHDAPVDSTSGMFGALTSTGSGTAVDTAPTGIATYAGYLYDNAGRLIQTVSYGTNKAPGIDRRDDSFSNGAAPTWPPASPPDLSDSNWDNHIISAVRYGPRGYVDESIDPLGRRTRLVRDDLDRVIATIENFTGADPVVAWNDTDKMWAVTPTAGVGSSAADENRVTWTAHFQSGSDWIIRQGAQTADASANLLVQATDTVMGVTKTSSPSSPLTLDSLISSGDWVREVRTPDPATGIPSTSAADIIQYAYNALGELRGLQDQNQVAHRYSRDAMGRIVYDEVASFGSSGAIDAAIGLISADYDGMGRLANTRTATALAGTVKSHVAFAYNGLGLLESVVQDGDSDITDTSSHPSRTVGYVYDLDAFDTGAPGFGNRARLAQMTYPTTVSGGTPPATALTYHYGISGGTGSLDAAVNKRIGRSTGLSLVDTDSSVTPAATTIFDIAEYSTVGLGMISHVDLPIINAQLDRTIDHTGRRNYGADVDLNTQDIGVYPGWDRFGRVKRHSWVRASYNVTGAVTGGGGTLGTTPNWREYNSHAYGYDHAGNPTYRQNTRLDAGYLGRWVDRDYEYHHDGLDRLTLARRGVLGGGVDQLTSLAPMTLDATGGALSARGGSQKWDLDPLGNWKTWAVDLHHAPGLIDANATSTGGGFDPTTETQTRNHNQQNEIAAGSGGSPAGLTQPTLNAGADAWHKAPLAQPFAYAHDDNGSRVQIDRVSSSGSGVRHKLVYDAWNRLVRIEKGLVTGGTMPGGYTTLASYSYNGLHWRTQKVLPYEVYSLPVTERTHFTYNAAWQCILEETDTDEGLEEENGEQLGIDRVAQQVFGLRGINDALYRRTDLAWTDLWTYVDDVPVPGEYHALDGVFDNRAIYQLSDPQFSVLSVVSATVSPPGPANHWFWPVGRTIDRVEYEPYGRGRRINEADITFRGYLTVDDIFIHLDAFFADAPAADANDDGVITQDDIWAFQKLWFEGTPARDKIVGVRYDNPYGYCGYYGDAETYGINGTNNGFLYHVRHRVYDPIAGRWLQRDPAGFVDGMNLYEYCASGSMTASDPMGLCRPMEPEPGGPTGRSPISTIGLYSGTPLPGSDPIDMWGKPLATAAVTVASVIVEPVDWVLTGVEIYNDPTSPYSYVGFVPGVPTVAGRAAKYVDEAIDVAKYADDVVDAVKTAEKTTDAASATNKATDVATDADGATGIIYKRHDPNDGSEYVGRTQSPERFDARQKEHDRELGVDHEYEIIDRAKPGIDLEVAEEAAIRANGGIRREGGRLVNKRHEMSEKRYQEALRGSPTLKPMDD